MIIAMLAFLTPRPAEARTPTAEIVTLGLLLVLLVWLKLSYFVVGGAAAVLYAFRGQVPWRTLAIGAGVCAGGILVAGLRRATSSPCATDIMLADHVMAPRLFMEPDTAATLGNVYSPYRDANYGERVETPYWTRWSHRKKSGSEVASVTTQPVAIR